MKMLLDDVKARIKKNKVLNKAVFFDSIGSTNKYLNENDFSTGTVVVAGTQTAGRGKHGARWVSGRGGLWFSFVMNKKIKTPYIFVMLTSVAILETINKYGIKAVIKWPNDILVSGKKLAGILIENDLYRGRLVIGAGINVNNAVPEKTGIPAVSIKQALKKKVDLMKFFADILENMDHYLAAKGYGRKELVRKWIKNQAGLEGREIKFINGKKTIKGKVVRMLNGRIQLQLENGTVKNIPGDVFFI
jgi:BirA family transcriptional regulator, biotin operon repressor / biotin---[acetyl-CoA-carboxylase] ligase